VLYTDGLTEARDPAGDEYGADRLAALLGSLHALEPQALLSACLADHAAFRAGTPVSDDLTLLVLRRAA
jgi:serine phosphatase RsbU (regulator of sigma subunit)